ncbi:MULTISPECIES: methylated-DNA--[protein]-cysteine S-methyltransferase [Aerococcus]|uniref:methylated-DNA--[protein]-cysteine S-methyltransferase n=1 Tax=Aerococcus urinae (strain CCUG 59500 / ACS-120-V-Col10a) TaxID=2976812 RepID=UPI000200E7E2|nr:methylated-DNA--[protein]-cysteine S-methyltransferase [Aerococcus sp. Group 1]AEA01185.1 6-O-methylguanine DNA methyltransferase, DNA binding domain protein [Aerococcus sp. Group 1]MCY3030369.1 methylated-DNA--[protein]-cysteine S-methyltransferase [Aerococcus sp. Group 1]MCY3054879.1 methylated-DNA--[protein]-cysteine S-methyltransferase [Aerococcus sp. Group 1]MCY3056609.1 methylated-DNA--[protein]-cysteine S-methyltransferase [Aerococcus sp. Group 1]MCY3061809.1 methylated-DNA--[protein
MFTWTYTTPKDFNDIILISDGESLTGLYFARSRDAHKHQLEYAKKTSQPFQESIDWLDRYFAGELPPFTPKFRLKDPTPFRQEVAEVMLRIPYGHVLTYQDIANKIAQKRGKPSMSAQAVGGAVGWNPICLIIPCHRVVGKDKKLTGYGGGLNNKYQLLKLEGQDMSQFTWPKGGHDS